MKYYIHMTGGIGDHFVAYFGANKNQHDFQITGLEYLVSIKTLFPKSEIKLISHCKAGKSIVTLFERHPFIDKLEILSPLRRNEQCLELYKETKGFKSLFEYGVIRSLEKKSQPKIFLTKEEENFIRNLGREYITIHPYAAAKERIMFSPNEYESLINEISTFCPVVILGAENKNYYKYKSRKNVINLTNKTNLRTSAQIVLNSKLLIANNSSMSCVLSGGQKPQILLSYTKGIKILEDLISRRWSKGKSVFIIGTEDREESIDKIINICQKEIK